MPNPNPIPVTFPTNDGACPKCGYPVNYPNNGTTGQQVGLQFKPGQDKIRLTCNKCGYSVDLPPAS